MFGEGVDPEAPRENPDELGKVFASFLKGGLEKARLFCSLLEWLWNDQDVYYRNTDCRISVSMRDFESQTSE